MKARRPMNTRDSVNKFEGRAGIGRPPDGMPDPNWPFGVLTSPGTVTSPADLRSFGGDCNFISA